MCIVEKIYILTVKKGIQRIMTLHHALWQRNGIVQRRGWGGKRGELWNTLGSFREKGKHKSLRISSRWIE